MTSRNVTIFEGPDGGGKTYAARGFAHATGAKYVHFSNLPAIGPGLARCYVEAMLPALLGYQDVVLDRCWLSEQPYGEVFRGGNLRFGKVTTRMLDRLALRCGAVVVMCLPGEETAVANFNSRRAAEMLTEEQQLRDIYKRYAAAAAAGLTDLPIYLHNYTHHDITPECSSLIPRLRSPLHPALVRSAGNLSARVVLVGEDFGAHQPNDSYYQWPFASFSGAGCSQWVTQQLMDADVSEQELMWVNADQLNKHTSFLPHQRVIALGQTAFQALQRLGLDDILIEHPQFWRRFHASEPYRLAETIKEHL